MGDELRQIEIETARIKLERERLALDDELRRRQRIEDAKSVAADVTGAVTGDKGVALLKKTGKVLLWLFVAYVAIAIIAVTFNI